MNNLTAEGFADAVDHLVKADHHLAGIVDEHGLPPFWERPPGFATLALFIVEQQVSLASARAVFERLVALLGSVDAHRVASVDPARLAAAGLSRQKSRYLRELSCFVLRGELDLEKLGHSPDPEARRLLTAVPGVGPWTADVYLLAALGRPDVWPVGDRALQVATSDRLGLERPPDTGRLEAIGERWRPWRSAAARLLWHDYLQRRGRSETVVAGLQPSDTDRETIGKLASRS